MDSLDIQLRGSIVDGDSDMNMAARRVKTGNWSKKGRGRGYGVERSESEDRQGHARQSTQRKKG